eukprot:TRINITY_DN194_c0_g1_i18.p1 TRINITY_DN194_c0_g1~~TRINITY_DN194_c0_g1_i18.p1  ORF type:complete len:229 (+),score=72.35 TRINITY_DN194_c0_g1_i18:151-837(+)
MKTIILIAAFFVALAVCSTPSPLWSSKWQGSFTETVIKKKGTKNTTNHGTYYYDYTTKNTRLDRDNGVSDLFCGSVKSKVNTPCTMLTTKGVRLVIYPQYKECCVCCTDEKGCGPLRPDWLADAQYAGQFTDKKTGVQYYSYKKTHFSENSIYNYIDQGSQRVPYQMYVPAPDGSAEWWEFDTKSYKESIPENTFEVPFYCNLKKKCGLFTTCTLVQKEICQNQFIQK